MIKHSCKCLMHYIMYTYPSLTTQTIHSNEKRQKFLTNPILSENQKHYRFSEVSSIGVEYEDQYLFSLMVHDFHSCVTGCFLDHALEAEFIISFLKTPEYPIHFKLHFHDLQRAFSPPNSHKGSVLIRCKGRDFPAFYSTSREYETSPQFFSSKGIFTIRKIRICSIHDDNWLTEVRI